MFLSAPYAATVYQTLQRQSLESVISSKGILADGIANGLDYTLQTGVTNPALQSPQPPDWVDARESLRQRLLVSLSGGYDVDAMVQYQVTVKSPWTNSYARLSGPGTVKNATTDAQRRTQLSTGKSSLASTPLGKPTYLNFMVNVSEPGTTSVLNLDFDYGINEVEFNIVPVIDGYDSSDWLSLMLPFASDLPTGFTIDLGTPQIPLPLRSYPPAPSLLAQMADPPKIEPATYQDALHWEYAFTYQHQSLAVDHLQLEVTLNQTPPLLNSLAVPPVGLFGNLAQYMVVASDLWTILQTLPSTSTATALPTNLANAIETFATLVSNVATQWNSYWTTVHSVASQRALLTALKQETYRYSTKLDAIELVGGGWQYTTLTLTKLQADGTLDWPTMSVIVPGMPPQEMKKGTQGTTTQEYTFPADIPAFGLLGFELRFPGLHVAEYQNGTAQVSVFRNIDLSPDALTQSAFVFQTKPIAFPDYVTPLLSWAQEFDIGAWSSTEAQNPLVPVFNNIFDADPSKRTINVGIRYGYVLASKGRHSITPSLPVKYRPSFLYESDSTTGTVSQIITAVTSWTTLNNPTTDGSKWVFGITLYSSITGQTDRPVLEFTRLVSDNTTLENASHNSPET